MSYTIDDDFIRNYKSDHNVVKNASSMYACYWLKRPRVMVQIYTLPEGEEYINAGIVGTGIAECGRHDKFDLDRGINIATGRALKDIDDKCRMFGLKVLEREVTNG